MFEYLMPNLVMPTWPGCLLDEMSQSAVKRQIHWGKERGVPWGSRSPAIMLLMFSTIISTVHLAYRASVCGEDWPTIW